MVINPNSQLGLIMEFFENNPNKDIPHKEIVEWLYAEHLKRTGKKIADPDRGIRSLHQKGYLIKVSKGVYRYDPLFITKRDVLEDFTPKMKRQILERDGHRCVICGRGKNEGLELHVDHIKPKDKGGKATLENGQVLCSLHNFRKRNLGQTETGKKMFIRLREQAIAIGDDELIKFTTEVLELYEANNINSHIKWQK